MNQGYETEFKSIYRGDISPPIPLLGAKIKQNYHTEFKSLYKGDASPALALFDCLTDKKLNTIEHQGCRLIHAAVRAGNIELLQKCIDRKLNLLAVTRFSRNYGEGCPEFTALALSAATLRLECLDILLGALTTADRSTLELEKCLLHVIKAFPINPDKARQCLAKLIAAGVNLNTFFLGRSLLSFAMLTNDAQTIELFLQHGADPTFSSSFCPPVIVQAITEYQPNIIEPLFSTGQVAADDSIHINGFQLPLILFAMLTGEQQKISYLRSKGANIAKPVILDFSTEQSWSTVSLLHVINLILALPDDLQVKVLKKERLGQIRAWLQACQSQLANTICPSSYSLNPDLTATKDSPEYRLIAAIQEGINADYNSEFTLVFSDVILCEPLLSKTDTPYEMTVDLDSDFDLETINIKNTKINPSQTEDVSIIIAEALSRNINIHNVNFVNGNGGLEISRAPIIKALKTNTKLRQLEFKDCDNDDTTPPICEALSENFTLQTLSLYGNSSGPEVAKLIAQGLVNNSTLKYLNLADNLFRIEGIIAIAKALEQNHGLETLILGNNWMHEDEDEDEDEDKGKGFIAIATALRTNKQLKTLNLGGGREESSFFDLAVALEFAKTLESNTTLRELDFSCVIIDAGILAALCPALCCNTTLKSLSFESIWVLSLEDIAGIGAILKTNNTLKTLIFSSNNLGGHGAKVVAEALSSNCTLEALDLSNNDIGTEGAVAIANVLKSNGSLKTLRLAKNKIGTEGAIAVANALKSNCCLEVIDLYTNEIGPMGAVAIADAIKTNRRLISLSLWDNPITDQGESAIIAALPENRALRSCKLQWDNPPEIHRICQNNLSIYLKTLAYYTVIIMQLSANDELNSSILKSHPEIIAKMLTYTDLWPSYKVALQLVRSVQSICNARAKNQKPLPLVSLSLFANLNEEEAHPAKRIKQEDGDDDPIFNLDETYWQPG